MLMNKKTMKKSAFAMVAVVALTGPSALAVDNRVADDLCQADPINGLPGKTGQWQSIDSKADPDLEAVAKKAATKLWAAKQGMACYSEVLKACGADENDFINSVKLELPYGCEAQLTDDPTARMAIRAHFSTVIPCTADGKSKLVGTEQLSQEWIAQESIEDGINYVQYNGDSKDCQGLKAVPSPATPSKSPTPATPSSNTPSSNTPSSNTPSSNTPSSNIPAASGANGLALSAVAVATAMLVVA